MKVFMQTAINLAYENAFLNHGGPFGAIVVKDGKIIGMGKNEVTASNDPTAHAEIQAIRDACRYLNSFQLTDCEIYTSCEPCPMCLGAIYWARPKAVYFYNTREEAAAIGFDDALIYEQISEPLDKRLIPMKHLPIDTTKYPFELWKHSKQRVEY